MTGVSRVIRSLLFVAFFAPAESPTPVPAATPTAEASPTPVAPVISEQANDSIESYKAPVDVLTERMIGVASRAVRFDWRRKSYGVGATGGQLLEMNNFRSRHIGASARRPFGSILGDVSLNWIDTDGTPSSRKLALTPYRQIGRPSRFELGANAAYPLAEGVVTARPGIFPATELVFSAQGGLRYLHYPGAVHGANTRELADVNRTVSTLFSPTITTSEIKYLEKDRPGGMQVDRARYNLLAGLGGDVYFHSGGYVSPRTMIALPVTGSGLGWWWELSLDVGWMF